MKTLKYILFIALITLGLASCNNDGDFLTVNGDNGNCLDGNQGDIILDYNNSKALALSIYWNDNGTLSANNPLVAVPNNAIVNTIQMSASKDFTTNYDIEAEAGIYEHQFSVFDLNSILQKLEYEPSVSSPLYIRIKSVIGANIKPSYSNTIMVNVTPYVIDMTIGYVLNSKSEETGITLASPNSDSRYSGFIGAGAWYNWYLREGDGTKWGNVAVDGNDFKVTTGDMWNMWFPGVSGCYYVVLDTNIKQWSALLIPALTVSGDLSGEMTYDRQANKWIYTFKAASTGTLNVKISGTGKQYNISTGTNDDNAINTPVAFAQSGNSITFGSTSSNIAINVNTTGEVSLVLDLSDPKDLKCSIEAGSTPPVEINKHLWVSGADDGISGSWTFDRFLNLYNEDDLGYAGVINVNSLWGYKFYTAADDWDSVYGMVDGGTSLSGNLVAKGDNVTPPTPGLYLFDVSMKSLTYQLSAISTINYSGFNDDWSMGVMKAGASAGLYTCSVIINKASTWGFKIYINGSWDKWFGGKNGALTYLSDGIKDDAALAPGTYTLTVDLCNSTYSLK